MKLTKSVLKEIIKEVIAENDGHLTKMEPVNEKMRPAVKKLLKQKGYSPIFQAIDNSKRQFKQMRYSRGEIQDTLIDMFGDEDPKILQKIKESVNENKAKLVKNLMQIYKDLDKKFKKYDHTQMSDWGMVTKHLIKKFGGKNQLASHISLSYNDYRGGEDIKKNIDKLIKYSQKMTGKKLESVDEVKPIRLKGKSGMGKISHLGVPQPSKGVEKLFRIADKGFDKVGGVTVDGMSASLFKQIYNKANDDIKNKLNKKSEKELVRIIGRMWDKFGKNVKRGSSL